MYVCGWPFRPALILSPIEHFEIASLLKHFGDFTQTARYYRVKSPVSELTLSL
jgi:hypothetical protein